MKKANKKTITIIALVSVFLCGCPGCCLLTSGLTNLINAIGEIQSSADIWSGLITGFIQGGWMVCASVLLILIPFVLIIIAVIKRTQKEDLEVLEPTGVSKDDPLPPTS